MGSIPREIFIELGRTTLVGGQEDMIVDVALDLSKRQKHRIDAAESTPIMNKVS
jgi:4-hydroxy 2-oxovalerate aldolase